MTLEIERIVETLAAERAQVPFQLAVIFQVPIEQTLELERLHAQATDEFGAVMRCIGYGEKRSRCARCSQCPLAPCSCSRRD